MSHQIFKHKSLYKLALILSIVFFSTNMNVSYAQNCAGLDYSVGTTVSVPAIFCFISQIINFLLLSSGAVFIILILIGAYKYAVSVGDPKAIEGAKLTLTYALIGFLIVVASWTILNVSVNLFGIRSGYGGQGIFNLAQQRLCTFLFNNGILNTTSGVTGCN